MALSDGLEIVDGPEAGAWIKTEMTGELGSVSATVPNRFEAYVRILHPATDQHEDPISWAAVADELGRTVHPLAQWDAIVGANRYRHEKPEWPGREPMQGVLPVALLNSICEVLARHTGSADRCFFAVWTSHWDAGAELRRPLLDNGAGREYGVIAGPLALVIQVPAEVSSVGYIEVTPNMIWPADRTWFLASEIDFDSTLVGGGEQLVQEVLDDPRFEAFRIGPDDLLTWDADQVNPPLKPGAG
jgi:hypothetical protein